MKFRLLFTGISERYDGRRSGTHEKEPSRLVFVFRLIIHVVTIP